MVVAMIVTILLVLAAGIGISYLAANGILRTMGHRPQTEAAVLTAAEAGSGD